jgi:hypothetical protein
LRIEKNAPFTKTVKSAAPKKGIQRKSAVCPPYRAAIFAVPLHRNAQFTSNG